MSQNDIFSLCLLIGLLCSSAESCVQRHVQARVPQRLQAGYVVSKVNLVHCGMGHVYLTCSDPDFAVQTDGTILTSHVTTVPDDGKSFWIWVEDEAGQTWKVDVSLSLADQVSQKSGSEVLKRFKRRWRPLPFSITENDNGPFPKDVEFISSDSSSNYMVYYKIRGMGIDSDPMGVFSVNAETGLLQVLQTVDREQYPKFEFMAHVYNKVTNQESDKPLPITVNVQDVNDNPPQFSGPMVFVVDEQSRQGTIIGNVSATDKDEPNTLHTKIRYSLLNYTDLFVIDPESGILKTANNKLDREIQDRYFVKIEIKDMNGAADGYSALGVATVSLTDINDNPPTFKQSAYKVQVQENQANKLILRIPVDDMDLKGTPNWNAVYEITKGNESGNFWITTDPNTNEGLLYVTKPLDREKQDKLNLEVTARNQVPLVGTSSNWQKLAVEVDVQDVDEGPEFSAPIQWFKVKENVPNGTLIGTYTATDPETKSSNGIKYFKIPQSDPGSWISVMESTGELKTTNTIDRESPFVVNNTYNITVKAVDPSQKSGTGTVVILIQDVNDNIPLVPKADRVVCTKDGIRGSTLVEATDSDQTPYSAPFTFELSKDLAAKWKLKDVKDTSVVLEQAEDMPNGVYQVPLLIKDLQGVGQEQMVSIRICDCMSDGVCSAQGVSARLGAWAILAMLLALLLGLLLCLLLLFVCTTKGEKLRMSDDDDGSGGILIQSNTEAPGEEVKETPLLITPGSKMDVGDGSKGGTLDYRTIGPLGGAFGQRKIMGGGSQGMYGHDQFGSSFHKYDMATLDMWRSREILLDNKLLYFGEEDDGRFAADVLKPYGYEGVGSPAGSVGCCSILSDHDALDFLDSLGPKFRTLADVCTSKRVTGGQ